jgi:hypothetical protein
MKQNKNNLKEFSIQLLQSFIRVSQIQMQQDVETNMEINKTVQDHKSMKLIDTLNLFSFTHLLFNEKAYIIIKMIRF